MCEIITLTEGSTGRLMAAAHPAPGFCCVQVTSASFFAAQRSYQPCTGGCGGVADVAAAWLCLHGTTMVVAESGPTAARNAVEFRVLTTVHSACVAFVNWDAKRFGAVVTGACGRQPTASPCSKGPSPRSSVATALVAAANRGVSRLNTPNTFSQVWMPAPG